MNDDEKEEITRSRGTIVLPVQSVRVRLVIMSQDVEALRRMQENGNGNATSSEASLFSSSLRL